MTLSIILVGAITYAYKQLQTQNHFKTVPVLNSNTAKDAQTTSQQQNPKNNEFNLLLIGSDQRQKQKVSYGVFSIIILGLNKRLISIHPQKNPTFGIFLWLIFISTHFTDLPHYIIITR